MEKLPIDQGKPDECSSAVSAEPGAGALRLSRGTTWAWAARAVASEVSCPDSFACFFQFDAPTVRSV